MQTIHLLIPTHNRTRLLERLLDSLAADAPALEGVTTHVIENGSRVAEDLSGRYADRLSMVYHHFEEGNKSKALNAVITDLPEDSLLVFFDDDVRVEKGVVEDFKVAALKYGQQHFFGGPLRADYETAPDPGILPYLPFSAKNFDLSGGKKYRVFDRFQYFLGANWACFRRDLLAVGGFSPDYGPGAKSGARGQETDAQLRLFQGGGRPVFIGDAWVDHWVPARTLTREWIIDRIYRASQHRGKTHPDLAHTLVMLVKLAFSALLLPLQARSMGHLYRVSKAAGYFYGLSQRYLSGKS